MSKLIVAGSRTIDNYWLFSDKIMESVEEFGVNEIVSGGAKGADKMGEIFATEYGVKLKVFPADWDKHGRAAGHIRNRQMAEYGDALLLIWDGKSKGSASMLKEAKRAGFDYIRQVIVK